MAILSSLSANILFNQTFFLPGSMQNNMFAVCISCVIAMIEAEGEVGCP